MGTLASIRSTGSSQLWSEANVTHMSNSSLELVDGSRLSVEVDGATVNLARRDPAGHLLLGTTLAPVEAHRLSRALATAAFAAERPH